MGVPEALSERGVCEAHGALCCSVRAAVVVGLGFVGRVWSGAGAP